MIINSATVAGIETIGQLIISCGSIVRKAIQALTTGTPQSIEEEIKRLEAARMRASEDIIAEADRASGK